MKKSEFEHFKINKKADEEAIKNFINNGGEIKKLRSEDTLNSERKQKKNNDKDLVGAFNPLTKDFLSKDE